MGSKRAYFWSSLRLLSSTDPCLCSPPRGHRGARGGAPHQRALRDQVLQDNDLLLAELRPQHHAECGQGLR